MKTVDGFFQRLSIALDWLPGEVVGVILIIVAAGIAIGLHALAVRLIRPMLGRGNGYWRTLLIRTRGPTRLAFLIILISAAVKAAPFRATDEAILTQMLGVAFICLVGWTILRALQISSELHLRRYKLDVDDNLAARKHVTQIRILLRAASVLIFILTAAAVMMSFESVRQYGVSLLAAGGAAGIVVGLAAQPVLSNLLAGIQIAITQPVRIEDAVVVEGEWGWVEEITMTYAVVRLWDWRRLVLPIKYFIEQPFQNWTRETGAIIGSVMIYLDYTAPVAAIRAKAEEFARASPLWDRRVVNVQVSDARAETIELRILVSANTSPKTWDLRCEVREKVIDWLQREHPGCLPRQRMELTGGPAGDDAPGRRVRANASRSEPAEPVPAE